MKAKQLLLSAALLLTFTVNAQDVHFSQIPMTPLVLNPAEAALGHNVQAIINYKDQWRSVTSPYRTFNVSADFAVLRKPGGNRLGLGVNVFSDKAGEANMGTTTGLLHLSGVVAANDMNLFSAGISGGFGQRTLQYDKLSWDNQYDGMAYDPSRPSREPSTFANHSYLDLSAGLAWFYGKNHSTLSSKDALTINVGFAAHHLNKPVYSFYGENSQRLPVKLIAHGTADIGLKNTSLILEPSYLVMIQGGHREITPGMMVKYVPHEASRYTGRVKASAFGLGGYFRVKDAFVVATRYEFSNWAIGMSYDVNVSNLKTVSNARGGFEVSLRYMSPSPFSSGNSSRLFD